MLIDSRYQYQYHSRRRKAERKVWKSNAGGEDDDDDDGGGGGGVNGVDDPTSIRFPPKPHNFGDGPRKREREMEREGYDTM